eukprot:c28886_g1_i1 orf=1-207(+)
MVEKQASKESKRDYGTANIMEGRNGGGREEGMAYNGRELRDVYEASRALGTTRFPDFNGEWSLRSIPS